MINNILFKFLVLCHRLIKGLANRVLDKESIRPREFSNNMLSKYAGYFTGDVINVSGWKDGDGEGGYYREYFKKASGYTVSNIRGQGKGLGSVTDGYQEIELDLEKELDPGLKDRFDVVFNHTTLEHVYDFKTAFSNLCMMTRDIVILTVPVMQQIHHTEDFGDWWRPTTMTIARMLKENGLVPLVLTCNDQPFAPIYCFVVASKQSKQYLGKIEKEMNFQMGSYNYGSSLKVEHIENLL